MVVHPVRHNEILAASDTGGIFKSADGGSTWTAVDDTLATMRVRAMASKPGAPDVVVAAVEGGVMQTDDFGAAWRVVASLPNTGGIWDLAYDAAGTDLYVSTTSGLYALRNGQLSLLLTGNVVDAEVSPIDSSLIVAGTLGRIMRSSDRGVSWTPVVGGAPAERSRVAFSRSQPSVVYVLSGDNFGTLYKSIDAGQSMSVVWTGIVGTDALVGGQPWHNLTLWVNPFDSQSLIAAGVPAYRSSNGGASWTRIWFADLPQQQADFHAVVAHPAFDNGANRTVFVAYDQGMYRLNDYSGNQVAPLGQSLPNWQIYAGAVDSSTGRILVGSQDSGTAYLAPGQSTGLTVIGGDGVSVAIDSGSPDRAYISNDLLGVTRADSLSTVPSNRADRVPSSTLITGCQKPAPYRLEDRCQLTGGFLSPIALDPSDSNRLLAGGVRLWQTRNASAPVLTLTGPDGPTWQDLGVPSGTFGNAPITAVAISPIDSNEVWVGRTDGSVFRSGNSRAPAPTWTRVGQAALPGRYVTNIVVEPSGAGVYVTLGGYSASNVWHTADGGATWADLSGSGSDALPRAPVYDIAAHPSTQGFWLYAATEVGLFVSENAGRTWLAPPAGPSSVAVMDTFWRGNELFVATYGRSLWKAAVAPPTGSAPTAAADAFVTSYNTSVTIPAPGVLGNDTGAVNAMLVSAVTAGSLSLRADGGLTYVPPSGFVGSATFAYRGTNAVGTGNTATVTITVQSPGAPTATDDSFQTFVGTTLTVAAPGVLGNDTSPGGSALSAVLNSSTTNGTLALSADGSFTYTPNIAFSGSDAFTYRATNANGTTNIATVAIAVAPTPTIVQAPGSLRVRSIVGNIMTLTWNAPVAGPAPTGYLLEGGVTPGQVLAAIPTGSATPTFTLNAPNGAFYLRLKSLDGGQTSTASNEIRVYVNQPVAPSAPIGLAGMVNGQQLALSWRNTFGGGAPTNLMLDVTGALATSLPLGLVDTFTFPNVPAGTYTFSVRAVNATGSSVASNPVTLTFPGVCSGAPAGPSSFLAYSVGNTLHLMWEPSASGPATTSYLLNVTGAFNGAVPFATRGLSTPVPPGSYTFSVTAMNACGASAPTAPKTAVIP